VTAGLNFWGERLTQGAVRVDGVIAGAVHRGPAGFMAYDRVLLLGVYPSHAEAEEAVAERHHAVMDAMAARAGVAA
jgi:hypothetical protein